MQTRYYRLPLQSHKRIGSRSQFSHNENIEAMHVTQTIVQSCASTIDEKIRKCGELCKGNCG